VCPENRGQVFLLLFLCVCLEENKLMWNWVRENETGKAGRVLIINGVGITLRSSDLRQPDKVLIQMHILLFFFLEGSRGILGFELKASPLLGRRSTTWATPTALFALIILETGSHLFPEWAWTTILLFPLRWGLLTFLPRLVWNWDPPDLSLPSS
jgi:hypothetical protein